MTINNILLVKDDSVDTSFIHTITSEYSDYFDVDEYAYKSISDTVKRVTDGENTFILLCFSSNIKVVNSLIKSLVMAFTDNVTIILVLPSLLSDDVEPNDVNRQAFDAGVTEVVVEYRIELLRHHIRDYIAHATMRAGRILFVHSNEKEGAPIADEIRQSGYLVDEKYTSDTGWSAYRHHHYDLVVTEDILIGQYSVSYFVSSIRQLKGDAGSRPILVIHNGKNNKRRLQSLLGMGVNETIKVPTDPALLIAKIVSHINTEKRLKSYRYDQGLSAPLLDMATHTLSQQALIFFWNNFIAPSREVKKVTTLVLLSIEGITGFQVSRKSNYESDLNALLMNISECIKAEIRAGDIIARWSERTLAIVLNDCHDEIALHVIKRAILSTENILSLKKQGVTLSAGLVASDCFISHSIKDVTEQAKAAMVASTQRGINHVVSYTELR